MELNLLIFLGLVVCGSAHDPGMRVKFNFGLKPGSNFFYDIPKNTSQCATEGWVQTTRADGPYSSLALFCYGNNVSVCGLYDLGTTHLCGMQYAFRKSGMSNLSFDMAVQGYRDWTLNGVDYSVIDAYHCSEEYLTRTVEDRLASYNSSKMLQEDKIWLTGYNGVIDEFPITTSGLVENGFTEQSCVPWMGVHYYKNMTSSTECTSNTMYPWFCLTDYDVIIGYALMFFGGYENESEERDYHESPSEGVVKFIVKNGPQCLYDIANSPGVKTCHTYVIDKPTNVGCNIFG